MTHDDDLRRAGIHDDDTTTTSMLMHTLVWLGAFGLVVLIWALRGGTL